MLAQATTISLIAATNNSHKLEEIKKALGDGVKILTLQEVGCVEELPETQDTLEGNSFEKAAFVFFKYNMACFADDSGLEVDALQGAPGAFSAMYAGAHRNNEDNIDLLLKKLDHEKNRKARFRTVITLLDKDGTHVFDGIVNGAILTERRGSNGFGYDAVFVPEGYSHSFAEMTLIEKNSISHRSIAVKKLITYLAKKSSFLPEI